MSPSPRALALAALVLAPLAFQPAGALGVPGVTGTHLATVAMSLASCAPVDGSVLAVGMVTIGFVGMPDTPVEARVNGQRVSSTTTESNGAFSLVVPVGSTPGLAQVQLIAWSTYPLIKGVSRVANVTVSAPPAPVASLAATWDAAAGRVNLTWGPSPDNGGCPVMSYRVTRSAYAEPAHVIATPATATLAWSDPASASTRYLYEVAAVNNATVGTPAPLYVWTGAPSGATSITAESATLRNCPSACTSWAWSDPAIKVLYNTSTLSTNITGQLGGAGSLASRPVDVLVSWSAVRCYSDCTVMDPVLFGKASGRLQTTTDGSGAFSATLTALPPLPSVLSPGQCIRLNVDYAAWHQTVTASGSRVANICARTASPIVTITSPAANDIVAGNVTVTGTAMDVDTTITTVRVTAGVNTVAVATLTPITGGVSWTASVPTSALANGNNTLVATATDAFGGSGAKTVKVFVDNAPTVDLVVGALTSVTSPLGGPTIRLNVTNTGNMGTGAFTARFDYLNGSTWMPIGDVVGASVPAKGAGNVTIVWSEGMFVGQFNVRVTVDPAGLIAETSETNNVRGGTAAWITPLVPGRDLALLVPALPEVPLP